MKILIATDGSKYSANAAKKCCEFIKSTEGLEIKIISAVEPVRPVPAEPFGVSTEFYLEVESAAKKKAGDFVEEIKKIIEENSGDSKIKIETVIPVSAPKTAIVEEAKEWEADLIVVGSHGYGFWNRMFLGSVSDAVMHHAPCSVLVVREDEK